MKIATATLLTLTSAALSSALRPTIRGHKLVDGDIALSTDASEGVVTPMGFLASALGVEDDGDKQPSEESGVLDIARAFKVDSTSQNFISAGIKIFDFSENEYTVTTKSDSDTEVETYESAEDGSKKTAFNLGISGGFLGFTFGFSMDTSSLNKSNKQFTRIDHSIETSTAVVTMEPLDPHEYLLPEVKNFLLTRSPQAILDHIGPFYASQFTLGCKFVMSVVGEVSSQEQARKFETEVKAGYMKFIQVSVGGGMDKSSKESCTDYTTTYSTSGGDSTIWQSKTKTADAMLDEWQQSITADNVRPFGHKLKYIWQLLDHDDMDRAKADEVETYIRAQWEADASRATEKEKNLVPATWNKSKLVDGYVTIKQTEEEAGNYAFRSLTDKACDLVKGYHGDGEGLWGLDQLRCEDNSKCLKWGNNSYVGRLIIPKGIRVTSYWDWELRRPMNIYDAINDLETGDFWNRDHSHRAKGFRFTLLPGYTCNQSDECV